MLTAALHPGAAVFAQPSCPPPVEGLALQAAVHDASVIVIGTWARTEPGATTDSGRAIIQPEAFLKGATSARDIPLATSLPGPCRAPIGAPGDRLLLIVTGDPANAPFPEPERAWVLANGRATSFVTGASAAGTEADLVARIRALTGQYTVPAADQAQGAGMDWGKTVLPVGFAVLALFGVGLVLMRIWHRIDPS